MSIMNTSEYLSKPLPHFVHWSDVEQLTPSIDCLNALHLMYAQLALIDVILKGSALLRRIRCKTPIIIDGVDYHHKVAFRENQQNFCYRSISISTDALFGCPKTAFEQGTVRPSIRGGTDGWPKSRFSFPKVCHCIHVNTVSTFNYVMVQFQCNHLLTNEQNIVIITVSKLLWFTSSFLHRNRNVGVSGKNMNVTR